MKSTKVIDDQVKCPVCGAVNSFTVKRTGKAKVLTGLVALPLIAVAPKRLRCNGCGTNLKTGTAPRSNVTDTRSRIRAEVAAAKAVKARAKAQQTLAERGASPKPLKSFEW